MQPEYLNILLDNKDVFTTLILVPILWFFIRSQNKNFNKLVAAFEKHTEEDTIILTNLNKTLNILNNSIENHDKNAIGQFEIIKDNIGRKTIIREDAILLIKKAMLSGSYKKLDYLEKRLNKNNLKQRKDTIKRQIRTELLKLSDEEYLDFLDGFIFNGKKLGDLIRENFPFDEFLEEIFDCIFDEHTEVIPVKLKNILELMKVYQNECIEKIKTLI